MTQFLEQVFEDGEQRGWAGPGWYFWDEAGVNAYGPYQSQEEAAQQLTAYCETYLAGPEPQE